MTIHTLRIEVKKDSLRQTQDGIWKLGLTLHPDDIPTELLTDSMGQRYMMVLAPLTDDDQPREKPPEKPDTHPLVKAAGSLSNDKSFWAYTCEKDAEGAAKYIRGYCKIESRKELAFKTEAQKLYSRLYAQFMEWQQRGAA